MNFINRYQRSNLQSRRGMILLVIMAVLTFFAVLGMTFILMTGKNRDSAETAQLAAQNSKTAGNSPQELLEEGIMQVLVGPPKVGTTQSTNSALYECDLIGDMYGWDSTNLTVVTASFSANKMTPASADYAGRVVTIAEGPYKGQSTIILNSRGAIIPFDSGIGSTTDYAVSNVKCVINSNRAYQGGEANYDAADANSDTNYFMSLRYTGGANNIKVGRVVMPSYYRGENNRPGLTADELGGTTIYQALTSNSIKNAASNNASPWDVDNDGDGDNDSVWMNLGLPPRPMPDGTLVVPLYAILVEDMDGRLNVNAHSMDDLSTASTAYSSLGTGTDKLAAAEDTPATLDPTTMLNGQGFGPAEINMEALLGSDIVTDIVNSRKGANPNSNFFKYCFPELTSLEGAGFTVAGTGVTSKDFRSPLDFYGVMAGAIDQNGMFIWQKRGTVGSYGSSSYERDLGLAQPRGNRVTNSPSKPFSLEELEHVVRAYDDDSKKLESRLFNIVKDSNDIDSIRNLITTESWDMPYCDITPSAFTTNKTNLPEEVQAGFKLDINRPLTNYEENPTVADEERTQLAKDLYQIAKACVGQSKAAAQWAVNAVDFRDSDSVCTHLQIDGYNVWGCERPELLITETFAFHARMTEDSELGGWRSDDSNKCARTSGASGMIDAEWYDIADCPENPGQAEVEAFCTKYGLTFNPRNMEPIIALMAKVRANNSDGVADMDQVYKPESGLFIELYNPWLSADKQEATPSSEYTSGGVTLGTTTSNGTGNSMVDSAWRIAVVANNGGTAWAQDLREMSNPTIDRVLYFGNSTPQTGSFTYKANSSYCVKPGQFAIIGPTGNTYLARNEDSGAGARPITITNNSTSVKFDNTTYNNVCTIGVPDCGKARFSVTDIGEYTDPVDNTGRLTTPRDMPYDADSNRWTSLEGCNNHGLGEDFEQAGYRIVYLQRLANPYKAYNATTNPYITFDQMPVDLFSYSGRQNKFADYKKLDKGQKASVTDELAYKHADVFIKSRQRGETQVFAGSASAKFWSAEKIPGQTNKTAASKLSLSTSGSGRGAVIAAVKTNFYHSINRFEPRLYNLADTTVSGSTTAAKLPSYQSLTPYYFPNRPFNSVMELMLVPQVSAYELTSSANAIDKPVSAELATGSLPKYLYPTEGSSGKIDFLSNNGSKIFDYVRVQTPFVVTPLNVNTYYAYGTNQVSTTAAQNGYRWGFREPGKININSISHPLVWAALLGAKTEDEANSIAGLTSTTLYNDYWGKIFTENQGTRPRTFGSSDANYIAANYLIFRMNQTAKECQSASNNVYFQTQLMQRLSNLTTTRSNVFAVWVTVGFFEYQNGGIGKEYGLDTGSRQRYRAFYIIDRTRPVGYSPGMRMNADKTIILRRYLP